MLKSTTSQIYSERLNNVRQYIDANLEQDLCIEKVAEVACFSTYHFHRIFKSMVGENLSQYIGRLRLEKAAYLLKYNPKAKLSEVAIQCGFNSLQNFSRQFKSKFGFSASEFKRRPDLRNSKIYQTTHEKSFYHVHAASRKMQLGEFEPQVVWRKELRIAYVRGLYGEDGSGLIHAYQDLMAWAEQHGYFNRDSIRIGMSKDNIEITPSQHFRYDFGISVPTEAQAVGKVGITSIPEGTYVTVHCIGDLYKVAQAWDHLYKDWLPSSKYQPRHEPALEVFLKGPEEIGWDRFDLEVCIPIEPLR